MQLIIPVYWFIFHFKMNKKYGFRILYKGNAGRGPE
jgi:hypothetical protein